MEGIPEVDGRMNFPGPLLDEYVFDGIIEVTKV